MVEQRTKVLAVQTALNKMMKSGYFDICVIDKASQVLYSRRPEESDAYHVLSTLHCVHWPEMPRELRDKIPELIREVLHLEPIPEFTLHEKEEARQPPTEEIQTSPTLESLT